MKDKKEIYGSSKPIVILNAWRNYCRTSLIYRILERIGLR
jgi:hypothetical protein